MKKLISSCLALGAFVGMLFGLYFFIDTRYALSETVKQIEQRLDYKIVSDQYADNQKRIWQLQDRFTGKQIPKEITDELRELWSKQNELRIKMDKLETK